jgi:hypothetical protein
MHTVDHYLYHFILSTLMSYLDSHSIPYAKKSFEGLELGVRDRDFEPVLRGKWVEDDDGLGFRATVEIDGPKLAITSADVVPNPSFPDTTWTMRIKDVRVDSTAAFVVTGEARVESNTNHFVGEPQTPDAPYTFVPVNDDTMWFDQGRGSWIKMRRAASASKR